ncbi:ATP-dependent DNA ligase [Robertmurraya massiliosenegalensis]|uniref:ATP-dependent DNA ligase n=1 Tax=Robertmurraya massiliosenegalensis TaxID=1287657 RepID=UPI000303ECB2|nr:RNA ligase family protein [Robertmurraya massiliosenegalensis]
MYISPMLLQKSPNNLPFDDDRMITELKLDGIRLILSKFNGITKLYTRHHNEVTSRFKELLDLPLPDNIVLDGELIVTDQHGKPDFESVMERFHSNRSTHKIQYAAFDIVYYDRKKVTHLPLIERKSILEKVIPKDSAMLVSVQWTNGNATNYFDLTKQLGLEGIVQKVANSTYKIDERSYDWLKVINYSFADNIHIVGVRKDKFELLLQFPDGSVAGTMEFMPKEHRKIFYSLHKQLIIKETDKYIYLDPVLKCKVKYRNLTKNGYLRIPSFVEWCI